MAIMILSSSCRHSNCVVGNKLIVTGKDDDAYDKKSFTS